MEKEESPLKPVSVSKDTKQKRMMNDSTINKDKSLKVTKEHKATTQMVRKPTNETENISYWTGLVNKNGVILDSEGDVEERGIRICKRIWGDLYSIRYRAVPPASGDAIIIHFKSGWEISVVMTVNKGVFKIKSLVDKKISCLNWKDSKWFLMCRKKAKTG